MTLFSEILGNRYEEDYVTLSKKKEETDKTIPTTVQAPYPMEVKRISAWDLEACYIFDPIIFNSINKKKFLFLLRETDVNRNYDFIFSPEERSCLF